MDEVNAKQSRFAADQIVPLLRGVQHVVSIRGSRITTFSADSIRPKPSQELLAALLGPTGNLRAPTLKVGTTWIVGFNAQAYDKLLG